MSEDLRQIREVDLAIALIAKLAEVSGLASFTVELTLEEIMRLLKQCDVGATRVADVYKLEFKTR